MKLNTKHFGEIEVDDDKIIEFKEGLPGFDELRRFALLSEPVENDEAPVFYWLQAVDQPSLAFVMVDMPLIMPDYNPLVPEEQIRELGEYDAETFSSYNIAVLPDKIEDATVNLKAPVVINSATRLGKQIVCSNEDYAVRHYLFKKT